MKKEYTAPEMSVVEFKSEGVIAASVSSDKVTVTLDGSSNKFTVEKLSAQVRMDAVTVTYLE